MKVEWRIKSNNLPRSRSGTTSRRPFRFLATEHVFFRESTAESLMRMVSSYSS